jgi:hypothetical protein
LKLNDQLVDLKAQNEVLNQQLKILSKTNWDHKYDDRKNNNEKSDDDVDNSIKSRQLSLSPRWQLIRDNLHHIVEQFSPFKSMGKANMMYFVHQLATKPDCKFLSQFAIEVSVFIFSHNFLLLIHCK